MSQNFENCNGSKNIFIMRHGERVDFTFNGWISICFDENGKYTRKDLNMPVKLLDRKNYTEAYKSDTPLTNVGILEAKLTGEALALKGINIKYAFCSPALRCIQTCHGVLTGLSVADKVPIKIEPGLFEYLIWYMENFPQFMDEEELIAGGFNIDTSYTPQISKSQLKEQINETCENYYRRSYNVVRKLLQQTEAEGPGDILLVAHGASLDSCSRQLIGLHPRDKASLFKQIPKVPYCSLLQVQQERNSDKWTIAPRLIPSISHSLNRAFNYDLLFDPKQNG